MNTTLDSKKVERISDTDFSLRTKNILFRQGIHTMDDLCCLNKLGLYRIKGCGPKTEREILDALAKRGLSLEPEEGKTIPIEVPFDIYTLICDRKKSYYLTKPSWNRISEGDIILFVSKDKYGKEFLVKRKILSIVTKEDGLVNGYIILGF